MYKLCTKVFQKNFVFPLQAQKSRSNTLMPEAKLAFKTVVFLMLWKRMISYNLQHSIFSVYSLEHQITHDFLKYTLSSNSVHRIE